MVESYACYDGDMWIIQLVLDQIGRILIMIMISPFCASYRFTAANMGTAHVHLIAGRSRGLRNLYPIY